MSSLAILYQAHKPPSFGGILKPMKFGGYKDSGADIACALNDKIKVITPVLDPDIKEDLDWVFPDTHEGIEAAIKKGATCFWLNTLLYEGHPIENYIHNEAFHFVGQVPKLVGKFDDKYITNEFLHTKGLSISRPRIVEKDTLGTFSIPAYPIVIKPIRGRGSKGVKVIHTHRDFLLESLKLIDAKRFGNKIMVEEYLPNQEVTLSIMPPGKYLINGQEIEKKKHWPLPLVKRENHLKGIAPYSGIVPVSHNSYVIDNKELESDELKKLISDAIRAAEWVDARAPIRIDARQGKDSMYKIFDLNLKPNMTGASRPHRKGQDSLVMIAARALGWNYQDLLMNMLKQKWSCTKNPC